jgi:hypothetical protein
MREACDLLQAELKTDIAGLRRQGHKCCATLGLEDPMSRGLGRIQRECLRVLAVGERLTTFTIAAEVYQVKQNKNGDRPVNHAQHIATARALANLRDKGLLKGKQEVQVRRDGRKRLTKSRTDGRAERCCFWSMVKK